MTALDDYRAVAPRVTSQAEVTRDATSTVTCGLNDSISWVAYFDTPLSAQTGLLYSLGVLRKSDDAFVEFGIERMDAGGYRFGYQNWNPAGSFGEAASASTISYSSPTTTYVPTVGGVGLNLSTDVTAIHFTMEIHTQATTFRHLLYVNDTEQVVDFSATYAGNRADWEDWLTDETIYFRAGDGTFDGSSTTGTTYWTVGYSSPPATLTTKEVAQHGRHLTSSEKTDLYNAFLLVDWG